MKIYLAKSYKANPNTIIKFNNFIQDYGVEIKEYKGKQPYSHSYEFKDVKTVFVILPNFTKEFIGKGLYSQIEYCIEHGITVIQVLDSMKFLKIKNIQLYDTTNWTTSFGKIVVEDGYINLLDYLPINTTKKESFLKL